ncbi:synaptic vesicle glycoprotein 2B-like [Coccinella septempunctata]|uniref:synaptic vesicle glycoprotein 2B-like n=1 Tax=Coccinella septempunctata TaxID=41139 RepID=UPI001D065F1A|nr:synaptic vesicle glycoprotein 2B-like [Coccinella septempunctata]
MKNILGRFFTKKSVDKDEIKDISEADFETAIAAAGFGKFNLLLILLALPMCCSTIFETTTMSYVFPAAQCDLNLSLEDKGLLNAVTYAGTISSAFVWGFLFDTLGRKKLLIAGFLLNGIFAVLSSFSQTLTFLMVMKFLGGFIMCGPFAALTTYLSEIHSTDFRSKAPMLLGIWNAAGTVYLPFLASLVLPLKFEWKLGNSWVLHSWGLFLLLNAIPALLSAVIFIFLPESPKFLMTKGRNEEALKVFRMIYSVNTGKPKETYPVKKLVEEMEQDASKGRKSLKLSFKEGWDQMSPLFQSPLLKILVLVCLLQLFMTMSLNTLRLWFPQLFQAITDYKLKYGKSSTLCEMLSVLKPSENEEECFVNTDNIEVYRSSMIVATTQVCFYLLAGSLINLLGQKMLLNIVSLVSGTFAAAIYFSPNSEIATGLIAGFTSLASIGTNVILIIVVNLFPTTLRTMTVSLVMMCGRGAAMFGNIIFPYLLGLGCGPPFFSTACVLFLSFTLSLLIPKENKNFI